MAWNVTKLRDAWSDAGGGERDEMKGGREGISYSY